MKTFQFKLLSVLYCFGERRGFLRINKLKVYEILSTCQQIFSTVVIFHQCSALIFELCDFLTIYTNIELIHWTPLCVLLLLLEKKIPLI